MFRKICQLMCVFTKRSNVDLGWPLLKELFEIHCLLFRYLNDKLVEQSKAVQLAHQRTDNENELEASLTLSSVTLDNSAIVKAVATNAVGQVNSSARLNVESEFWFSTGTEKLPTRLSASWKKRTLNSHMILLRVKQCSMNNSQMTCTAQLLSQTLLEHFLKLLREPD